jgi:hypothetical protein
MESRHFSSAGYIRLIDMDRSKLILMLVVVLIVTGCHKEFRRTGRRSNLTLNTYSLKDSLLLKNYTLYSSQAHSSFSVNSKPVPVNDDSVINVIERSFQKVGLPLISRVDQGKNHVDSMFYRDFVIRIAKMDESWIKDIAGGQSENVVILPTVYLHNRITNTAFISSGGLAGSSGFHVVSFLNLIVFVVKDGQIIYSRQYMHTSERTWANSREEAEAIPPAPLVTQEHWDELVRLAMKDYIKRMK